MSSTLEHFSHPEHPLVLKGDAVIAVDAACSVCSKAVVGTPTYTCISDDIGCQYFYLHKTCAELPKQIIRDKLDQHPLALLPRPGNYKCDICSGHVVFAYACENCYFDLCVACAFSFTFVSEQKEIIHEGHEEHTLTLQRQALFHCDACWEESKDYSYVCFTCDFWIHKKCAFSPRIIPVPCYHHHPLTLIFSIPVMYRYFPRHCPICRKQVEVSGWSYYCHKCTFFVHMECSTSTLSFGNDNEDDGVVDNEPDLIQFPLPGEESIFDLIITQCSKFQVDIQGADEYSVNISTMANDPHIIEQHWSHPEHPLQLKEFTASVNDNNDNDDKRKLICDGCIQSITVFHPLYYACFECGFFLHSFCANRLPSELPLGASPFHPQHSFLLYRMSKFYNSVDCEICKYPTNGFVYECQTCDIKIDIRCVFLPTRIRHKSHKHHSLVQSRSSNKICDASKLHFGDDLRMKYACEICTEFQVDILCAFYPSRTNHRYDEHSLMLRLPPFFYEGVIYCQICEEQVNNQMWLYHCDACDQCFHYDCVLWYESFKLGGTLKHSIDGQSHTLALVFKKNARYNSLPYNCVICGLDFKSQYFSQCEGCGYLACIFCTRRIHDV